MKAIYIYFTIGLLSLNAQSGIITYTGYLNQRYIDSMIKVQEAQDIPMHIKQTSIHWYQTAKPIELELKFKGDESYYVLLPDLNSDGSYNTTKGAVSFMPYYTNSSDGRVVEFNPYVGNTLIDEPSRWDIRPMEMKKIGNYNCLKAITEELLYSRQGFYYTEKVTAWFCPDIPAHFGPLQFSGLPGLVLEVEKDRYTITATKIVLNPKKEVVLNVPEIGRTITQSEQYKRYEEREKERQRERANQK